MKKLTLAALMACAGLTGVNAHAAAGLTATGTFDVNIELTSKCEINSANAATGAVIGDLGLTYTSFQTTDATNTTTFNVRCTNGLGYTLALDNTTVTDDALDLEYTLALSVNNTAIGPDPITGTGADQQITVTGTIAGGQAGTCAETDGICLNTAAGNKQRTLTVSY
jgi:opacity protein-like surface antigen